jgi:hypothetical protein
MLLLKDLLSTEEIKNIIKNRQNHYINNEYDLIKLNDDNEILEKFNNTNEIEDLQKEINQINVENDTKYDQNNYYSIDELKGHILDNNNT